MVTFIESPREGMQGVDHLIPTEAKIRFINALLQTGFHTVELGSIVNPKIVPQMADTLEVIRYLDLSDTKSERMVLVMSSTGAERVAPVEEISILAYPFSFCPSFLMNNVRATVNQALNTTGEVANLCIKSGKKAVIYISYAFGNPYGDPWSIDLLLKWVRILKKMGIRAIPLSNVSLEISPSLIEQVFTALTREFPDMEFGLHLHTNRKDYYAKIDAAYKAGCRRFDTVINGQGGCPVSGQEMMGNLATQNLVSFLQQKGIPDGLDPDALHRSVMIANEIYR
ncbi:MAG: hydroxymethylglutaryl-CoA lyase [Bacteroidota bacterium]